MPKPSARVMVMPVMPIGFHGILQGFEPLLIGNDGHVIHGMAADRLGTGHDRIGDDLVQGDFFRPLRRFPGLQASDKYSRLSLRSRP